MMKKKIWKAWEIDDQSRKENENNEYLGWVDFLEFISVLAIAAMHYSRFIFRYGGAIGTPFYERNILLKVIEIYSDNLVELLFMLSGLVIYHGYFYKITTGKITFDSFIFKRIKRLYPFYIFTTLSILVTDTIHMIVTGRLYINGSDQFRYSLSSLFKNFFMLQGGWIDYDQSYNGIAWYLSVLIGCYILFFAALKIRGGCHAKYIYLILILIGLTIINYHIDGIPIVNIHIARGLESFFIGCLLADLRNKIEFKKFRKIASLYFFTALLWILCSAFIGVNPGNLNIVVGVYACPAIILLFWLTPLGNIFNGKWTKRLFKPSYYIYLIHVLVLIWMHLLIGDRIDFNSIQMLVFYLALVVILGYMNSWLFNKLFYKDKMSHRI